MTSRSTGMYAEMAAALFSSDVLQTIYGPIPEETNLPLAVQPDVVAYFDVLISWPKVILKNGFVFGEWMYQKEMPTIMIF